MSKLVGGARGGFHNVIMVRSSGFLLAQLKGRYLLGSSKASACCSTLRNYGEAAMDIDEEYVKSDQYKKEIVQARARIFGHVIGNGLRSGHQVLKQKLMGEQLAKWYPLPIQHLDYRFKDPREERRIVKLEKRKRAGKGRPKKGQGKRATGGKVKKK